MSDYQSKQIEMFEAETGIKFDDLRNDRLYVQMKFSNWQSSRMKTMEGASEIIEAVYQVLGMATYTKVISPAVYRDILKYRKALSITKENTE